ncbi:MAG: nucleotide-binding domain containing protein [Candidatus Sericytochromatia bacterium]|nr:nucleotide-binding domain containing protein [Candidatus Sericytochromatia bacterium]
MALRIIADSLTNAAEALLAFHQAGLDTRIDTGESKEDAAGWVVAQALGVGEVTSEGVVLALGPRLLPQPPMMVFDGSGLTPLVALVREVLSRSPARLALLTTGHPAKALSTMGGYALDGGLPVSLTERGRPASGPPPDPYLPSRLAEGGLRVWTLSWSELQRGPEATAAQFLAASAAEAQVIVADAADSRDLDLLAHVALGSPFPVMPAGTAGLAAAWARALARRVVRVGPPRLADALAPGTVASVLDAEGLPDPQRLRRLLPGHRPVLSLCGSVRPSALEQATHAAGSDGPLVLDASALLFDESPEDQLPRAWHDVLGHAQGRMATGRDVVLTSARSAEDRDRVLAWGRAAGLPETAIRERLCRALGRVVRHLTERTAPAGLILTGGETAAAVWQAMDWRQGFLEGAAEVGLPILRPRPGDLRVLIRAGGAGRAPDLGRAIDLLRRLDGLERHQGPMHARPSPRSDLPPG